MLKVSFLAVVLMMAMMFGGCEEQQLQRVDRIVTDANEIVAAGGSVLQSPAGAMLTPGFQLYGAAGIAIASIVLNAWQKVRANLMTKTTKAIVKGIEAVTSEEEVNPTYKVKASIAAQMKKAGIYSQADDLINKLKISR